MLKQTYEEYLILGLTVIPIEWDIEYKQPVSHRFWSDTHELKLLSKHNGLMIKTENNYAAIDFDLKNTSKKELFKQWYNIVSTEQPEILKKVFIEQTRSKGYHVWIRYNNLKKKTALADSKDGNEVIALYANGPLVYTFPTPGYTEYLNSMNEVEELTDDEYNYLICTSQFFNEYKPSYDPTKKAISYPKGFEQFLSEFDKSIDDNIWHQMLNDIGLIHLSNYRYNRNDKFIAYKRAESTSNAISAKVYFKTKRLLLFTASMHQYPNWHNKDSYPVWALPPSFVLFYKNNRDWNAAIDEAKAIIESSDIEIETPKTTGFPLHAFPEVMRQSILEVAEARSLAPAFLATAGLWTLSSLCGTQFKSDFNGDGKNIIFALMIAPISVGKTPAFKAMCETPLKAIQEAADKNYIEALKEWEKKKHDALHTKESFTEKKPRRYIPFAIDGTTEGYIALSMDQPNGLGVYHDEAESILNAGSFKSNNDSISFFTQCFSGGRLTQIRADRDKERVVPNMNINLLMGTQPVRLKNIFTEDRISSGFASRFLMVRSDYVELNVEVDPFTKNKEMCSEWVTMLEALYNTAIEFNKGGYEPIHIPIEDDARTMYINLYRNNLKEANQRILTNAENHIIGTEAKMSAYFPRLVQLLAVLHNFTTPLITPKIVQYGYELYKYFAAETSAVISGLNNEIETGLPNEYDLLFQTLPEKFTAKEAKEVCVRLGYKERKFEMLIKRKDFKTLFRKCEHGIYTKL